MKVECTLNDIFEMMYLKLQNEGILLTSIGRNGRYNAMTIGWGLIGRLWRESVFMIAIRPTRYTHKLIEETNEFTINVPDEGMEKIVNYCGNVSGRDCDKFKEMNLTVEKGIKVTSPLISECIAYYECKVIGKSKYTSDMLSNEVKKRHYSSGNYHTLYFGKILSTLKSNQ
jgi:flavin reductase (DIM6/NTAB) family NADH-FMN oxidoreductase RutF